MFTTKRIAAGFCAAALLAAAPAFAADAPPDAHKLELAKRFFAAMHMDQMMGQMMRQMGPAMEEAMAKDARNGLTPEQRKAITEVTAESMQAMMAKMEERMAPIYAETFSEKELQDLVTFYEGPTAQDMLAKTPALTAKMMPTMLQLMPEMQQDMRQRLCAKLDCSKLAQPPVKTPS